MMIMIKLSCHPSHEALMLMNAVIANAAAGMYNIKVKNESNKKCPNIQELISI